MEAAVLLNIKSSLRHCGKICGVFFALNMEFSDCVYMDVQCLRSGEDQCEKATGRRNMEKNWNERVFCRVYLETMDPEQAAAATGQGDGLALLGRKSIQKRMERMRGAAAGQLRREDVLRHLARIAFGRVNDAVELALRPETANPAQMDLSALSELKVTEKGVELKLVDRIRALETLFRLLVQGDNDGAEGLYQALEALAGALGDEDGE